MDLPLIVVTVVVVVVVSIASIVIQLPICWVKTYTNML